MNNNDLKAWLEQASAFELYRLHAMLERMMDDPRRLVPIKAALHLGRRIQYYEPNSQQVHEGIVERIKQTRVMVRRCSDNQRWDIPLCAIHVGTEVADAEFSMAPSTPAPSGLTKQELALGDRVCFQDKSGIEHIGVVVRLNIKTASIDDASGGTWRVSYGLLHKVIDIEND